MDHEIKNVNLSFCCKEDWNGFASIDDKTRFCGSCKHKVVDFTNANESEFNQLIASGEKICGRFKRSQVNDSFLLAASIVVAASASSISCTNYDNVTPQTPKQEFNDTEFPEHMLMGVPVVPFSVVANSIGLPIIVGDAPKGEEPLRYNPATPSKGFYKKK